MGSFVQKDVQEIINVLKKLGVEYKEPIRNKDRKDLLDAIKKGKFFATLLDFPLMEVHSDALRMVEIPWLTTQLIMT